MRLFSTGVLLLLSVGSNAAQVTIDFEGLVADDGGIALSLSNESSPVLQTKGFDVTYPGPEHAIWGRYGADNQPFAPNYLPDYGSAYLEFCSIDSFCPNQLVTISNSDDKAFSLLSLDMINEWAATEEELVVTGYFVAGGSVSMSGFADGEEWRSMQFGSEWQNLSYITIDGAGDWVPGIDNISVSAVPVPAAVWLFGSALAGLGWMRRKRTSSV